MEAVKIFCPKCNSNNYTFNGDTRLYSCNNCNHKFTTVFISYGHDEYSNLAFKIEEDLEKEGIIVWIDKEELHAGKDWELKIERGLLGTQMVLSMLTPHSVGRKDGFCRDELSYARTLGRKIVPIMVREVVPPLSIHRIQWLDFRDWPKISEETYKKKFGEIYDIVMGKLLSFEGGYSRLLDSLEPLDFGVEIDKYIANFYGREWIFDIVNEWFKSDEKVFLLTGNPGVGKTAIAAMLCHKYSDCAVYHLVKYNDARKSDACECILSLTFQLATRLPKYAEMLLHMNLEGKAKTKAVNSLFDEFILQPLHKMEEPSEPILIVIDALDEASSNDLVRLIADNFSETPSWLKLFITTRPVIKIINALSSYKPFHLKVEEKRNIQDVRGYLENELSKISPNFDLSEKIEIILNKSKGLFLYVRQLIEEIKKDPKKLENLEQFPQGLYGIYQMFFERQFPNSEVYNEYQRPLFNLITAAYEPLDLGLVKSILGDNDLRFKRRIESISAFLEIEDDSREINKRIRFFDRYDPRNRNEDFERYRSIVKEANKYIKPFHTSLIEWLTDERTEVDFFIDVQNGHNMIQNFGWNLYKTDISKLSYYFIQYLPLHLLAIKKWDNLSKILSDPKYIELCYNWSCYYYVLESDDLPDEYRPFIESAKEKYDRKISLELIDSFLASMWDLLDNFNFNSIDIDLLNGLEQSMNESYNEWSKNLTLGEELSLVKGEFWYIKACFEVKKNNEIKALEYLNKAIEFDEKWKNPAKNDDFFYHIRNSKNKAIQKSFRKIVGKYKRDPDYKPREKEKVVVLKDSRVDITKERERIAKIKSEEKKINTYLRQSVAPEEDINFLCLPTSTREYYGELFHYRALCEMLENKNENKALEFLQKSFEFDEKLTDVVNNDRFFYHIYYLDNEWERSLIFKKIDDWLKEGYISIFQNPNMKIKLPILSAKAIKKLKDLQEKLFQSGFKIKKKNKKKKS
ncbi:MAG: TIR domain-containing protein [Candidatus Thorarchaeota archaeon]